MELMIVLVVVLAFASIVTPAMVRMYSDHQLKTAVEEVRAKLAGCRGQSIDTGLIYQFRFEPIGQRFVVLPYELEGEVTEEEVEGPDPRRYSGQLPGALTFQTVPEFDAAPERLSEEWLTGLPDASQLAETVWSPAVLFFPDGTAMDVSFEVQNSAGQTVRLSVRGLTGAASAARVERRSPL